MALLSKTQTKVKNPGTVLVMTGLVGFLLFKLMTGGPSSPSVDIGKSYVLKDGVPACKTVDDFEKVMTLRRAQDQTSVNLYLASGTCDVLKKGDTYAITNATVGYVEATKYAKSMWAPRQLFADHIEQ
jgi:hypothetical protein